MDRSPGKALLPSVLFLAACDSQRASTAESAAAEPGSSSPAEGMEDDDPRAAELMEKLRKPWDEAPVWPELYGQAVKLPGFTVPLEGDSREPRSFLLVPYHGACIHVPPPPANQTVYTLYAADVAPYE